MPTRDIWCMNRGLKGENEIYGLNTGTPMSMIFRHLGHNPFSGDMRYRCPACDLVLLVNPVDVIGDGCLEGLPEASCSKDPLLCWILRGAESGSVRPEG